MFGRWSGAESRTPAFAGEQFQALLEHSKKRTHFGEFRSERLGVRDRGLGLRQDLGPGPCQGIRVGGWGLDALRQGLWAADQGLDPGARPSVV